MGGQSQENMICDVNVVMAAERTECLHTRPPPDWTWKKRAGWPTHPFSLQLEGKEPNPRSLRNPPAATLRHPVATDDGPGAEGTLLCVLLFVCVRGGGGGLSDGMNCEVLQNWHNK